MRAVIHASLRLGAAVGRMGGGAAAGARSVTVWPRTICELFAVTPPARTAVRCLCRQQRKASTHSKAASTTAAAASYTPQLGARFSSGSSAPTVGPAGMQTPSPSGGGGGAENSATVTGAPRPPPKRSPRRTRIVATIGPASEDPDVLDQLLALGVDTVRVNYSHGTVKSKTEIITRLRAAEEKSGRSDNNLDFSNFSCILFILRLSL